MISQSMHRDAPASYRELIAVVPVSDGWKGRLHELMSGPDRFYHGLDHLALLFDRHRSLAQAAGFDNLRETTLVACAIAFHDCIVDAHRTDNEERSARAWLEASQTSDLDMQERIWVADTIRATGDHLAYGRCIGPIAAADRSEALRLWVLDLDLTPFGEEPEVFDRNTRLLREEASHLDDGAFEAGLMRTLRRYANAPVIYRTAVIADRFDASARRNIARRLSAADVSD